MPTSRVNSRAMERQQNRHHLPGYIGWVLPRMREDIRVSHLVDLWAITRLLLRAWDQLVSFCAKATLVHTGSYHFLTLHGVAYGEERVAGSMKTLTISTILSFAKYHTIKCMHKTISYRIYCKYHSRWRMHNPELLSQLQLWCCATPMRFLIRWIPSFNQKKKKRLRGRFLKFF